MPLGPFEREVLRLLATNRNPDSYVGGATVLHQTPDSPRSSEDIDLFHDEQESVEQAFTTDVAYVFTVGGAGDPPAPPCDSPGALAAMSGCEKTVPFRSIPLPVPSGGSPDGTGGSPVLPTLNTYGSSDPAIRTYL